MGAYFLKKQARSPILEGFGRNIYALLSFSGQQYFYIILNMGLGGNADSWAGPIDDTDLPAIMEIDWVKVSKLNK